MKALFIHRSVGHNLIIEGQLRELLRTNNVALDDYDNNNGTLTKADSSITMNVITIPGNNTNPDNLASFFMNWTQTLDGYDLIIIKSCYPNSHIKDKNESESIKRSYQKVLDAFMTHQKQLILLTSPPLRPLFTNKREANFVRTLNEWLLSSSGKNIHVLDFHALLAEPNGRHKGMLRRDYRRLLPFDNHPNKKANREVAPLVANFIASLVNRT